MFCDDLEPRVHESVLRRWSLYMYVDGKELTQSMRHDVDTRVFISYT